jgi:hypothetical protein
MKKKLNSLPTLPTLTPEQAEVVTGGGYHPPPRNKVGNRPR